MPFSKLCQISILAIFLLVTFNCQKEGPQDSDVIYFDVMNDPVSGEDFSIRLKWLLTTKPTATYSVRIDLLDSQKHFMFTITGASAVSN